MDKAKGEKRDREKCIAYFKKVLEEEPERVGKETYRARSFLTSYASSGPDRVRVRMDVYAWLQDIEISKNIKWLPNTPKKPTSDLDIERVTSLFLTSGKVTARNMTFEAYESPDGETLLQEIIDRFPGSYAEGEAKKQMKAVTEKKMKLIADGIFDADLIEKDDAEPLTPTTASQPVIPTPTPTPKKIKSADSAQPKEPAESTPWIPITCAIVVCLICASVFTIRRKKKE